MEPWGALVEAINLLVKTVKVNVLMFVRKITFEWITELLIKTKSWSLYNRICWSNLMNTFKKLCRLHLPGYGDQLMKTRIGLYRKCESVS